MAVLSAIPSGSLWLLLLLAFLGSAQEPTSTNTTETTVTATTGTATLTTTTAASCDTLQCPDGFVPKDGYAQLLCSTGVCSLEADLVTCCDQLCPGLMRCPFFFLPRMELSTLRCTGLCDQETDRDTCCEAVAYCSELACPDGFLPKEDYASRRCAGKQCDLVKDLPTCCNQNCVNFSCPSGSRLLASLSCVGRCDAVMDRRNCCDFSVGIDPGTQLIDSARLSDVQRVRRLGVMRADVTLRDSAGSSALHHAVLHGHVEMAQLLLEQRAEMHAADGQGWTPLHVAASRGHEATVALLVGLRGDPTKRTPPPGQLKPLHMYHAVYGPSSTAPVVKLLIEAERLRNDAANIGERPHHLGFPGFFRREL